MRKPILLVARDQDGTERSRQECQDYDQAMRLMIARNNGFYPKWGIETTFDSGTTSGEFTSRETLL